MTSRISTDEIDPSPHRNFELYPLDKEQVKKLQQSFKTSGDFGVLPARKVGNRYQIACGHHRLEAMRQLEFKTVDLKVSDLSDECMLQIMIQDNASQQHENAASVLDAVAAVTQTLLIVGLTSQPGTLHARGISEGIGHRAVLDYINKNAPGQISKHDVVSAMATLRASDQYAKLTREAVKVVKAQYPKGSEQSERADKLAANIEAKEDEKERAAMPGEVYGYKNARGAFDATCATLFKNSTQLDAFRKIVTGPQMAVALPVNQQPDLAKAIIDDCTVRGKELTVKAIKEFTSDKLSEFFGGISKADRDAHEKLARANVYVRLDDAKTEVIRGLARTAAAVDHYRTVLATVPGGTSRTDTDFTIKLRLFIRELNSLETSLSNL
jgi:ParB-like nuclease family protein